MAPHGSQPRSEPPRGGFTTIPIHNSTAPSPHDFFAPINALPGFVIIVVQRRCGCYPGNRCTKYMKYGVQLPMEK